MVVLMRMNMPPEYRAIITEVLGDLQFNFYHRLRKGKILRKINLFCYLRWFDVMFLVAATCTIALLYLAHTRDKGDQGSSLKDE